jgi:S-DNA-T family DNA segregation ATPase FtsK/SpoIIIE
LDSADWFTAEHPRIIWLGQDFNIGGQAKAILRRRTAENMLIVGSANAPRYGMLAAALASLSVSGQPSNTQIVIIDRCIPGTPWSEMLKTVHDSILCPAGFSTYFSHDRVIVDPLLDDLLVELTQRQQLSENILTHVASIFVMITEPDRAERLRRKADTYGLINSPSGEKLHRLLVEGPPVGIHTILSFTGMCPMTHVLDDHTSLVHFRHRVALQMSEDESFTFVRSRKAAQLQTDGAAPICALYLDAEHNTAVRFKPYSTDQYIGTPQNTFIEHIHHIGQRLTLRNQLSKSAILSTE